MSKKNSKIAVLDVKPQKKSYIKKICNALESLQHEVGGYIQAIYLFEDEVVKFMISLHGHYLL